MMLLVFGKHTGLEGLAKSGKTILSDLLPSYRRTDMNPAQILSVLSALAVAVWAVWTWNDERQKAKVNHR